MPHHDFLYLGDNARSPYGTRSFETIYDYTLAAVKYLFSQGCQLVVLACNTASAKALRSIQVLDLPKIAPEKRVLGVIRPTAEVIGQFTESRHIGILATNGTVKSESYRVQANRFFPEIKVFQQACPMWVPLIENGEMDGDGTEYFVQKYLNELLSQSPQIDTLLLACTHYPLLLPMIHSFISQKIKVVSQGGIVAKNLKNYLHRHPEMGQRCSQTGQLVFCTTGDAADFDGQAGLFFGKKIKSLKVSY